MTELANLRMELEHLRREGADVRARLEAARTVEERRAAVRDLAPIEQRAGIVLAAINKLEAA